MRVIFFGTPPFAAHVLCSLFENGIEVVAIVTKPDTFKGKSSRGIFSAVKKRALANYPHIPLYQPHKASDPQFEKVLKSHSPDLFVVVAYGEIIKENILKVPKLNCLNVHPSLLPEYRGAAPIHFALLNGDSQSGTTIMEMAAKMDAGAIFKQNVVPIPPEMNFEELEKSLCQESCSALLSVIRAFEKGEVQKTDQNHDKATYVKKITPSMAHLDWKESATVLHNKIRAFSPTPGAWCTIEGSRKPKRLKIIRSRISSNLFSKPPGQTIQYGKDGWTIACGQDALELLEIQLEGKKKMCIKDFLCGCPQTQIFGHL